MLVRKALQRLAAVTIRRGSLAERTCSEPVGPPESPARCPVDGGSRVPPGANRREDYGPLPANLLLGEASQKGHPKPLVATAAAAGARRGAAFPFFSHWNGEGYERRRIQRSPLMLTVQGACQGKGSAAIRGGVTERLG